MRRDHTRGNRTWLAKGVERGGGLVLRDVKLMLRRFMFIADLVDEEGGGSVQKGIVLVLLSLMLKVRLIDVSLLRR